MPNRSAALAASVLILALMPGTFANPQMTPAPTPPAAVQSTPSSSTTDAPASTPPSTDTSTSSPETTPSTMDAPDDAPPDPPVVSNKANPAFLLTPEDCAKAIDKGIKFADRGKTASDMLKDVRTGKLGHKGDVGHMTDNSVTCTSLDGAWLASEAFDNASHYKTNDNLRRRAANGLRTRWIDFVIRLGVRGDNPDDLRVTDFVLTDDKGNVLRAVPRDDSGPQRQRYSARRSRTWERTRTYIDSNGNFRERRTTYRVPYTVHYSINSETYYVRFKMGNEAGQYFIADDAKSITLHMVTDDGERNVTFDLNPPKI